MTTVFSVLTLYRFFEDVIFRVVYTIGKLADLLGYRVVPFFWILPSISTFFCFGFVMGPDESQLCFELYELENDLFSYNSHILMDSKNILKAEITKEIWDGFTKQIKHCEGITYRTSHAF